MRIRLEFSRGEKMMYLSHLDLMRTFNRAMRRGGIPISYTAGYNPHARMVFGLPLQVGVTSDAEYLDIEIDGEVAAGETTEKLNGVLPEGLTVTNAREMKANANIMSIITHAAYEMRVGRKPGIIEAYSDIGADLKKAVDLFRLPGPRIVEKPIARRKKNVNKRRGNTNGNDDSSRNINNAIDLAPLVKSIETRGDILAMTVTAGAACNIKPDLVLETLNSINRDGVDDCENRGFIRLALCRKALFVERGEILYKPIDNEICG